MTERTISMPDPASASPTVPADGVIKYTGVHHPAPPPVHSLLDELGALRTDLFDLKLIGVTSQGVGYGNLSVRGQGAAFVITGSGTGAVRVLSPAGYCLVTACYVDSNSVESAGPVPASSESMSHAAVYEARADALCVAHIHSSTLFARLLAQHIPRTPAEAAYGTPGMARAISRLAAAMPSETGLLVMTGHQDGILAFGPNIASVRHTLMDLK